MEILIVVGGVGLIIALAIFGALAARKRREEMAQLALRLGLTYRSEKDYSLAERFSFLDKLAQGSNRYAFNLLSGRYQGHEVLVFAYRKM